MIRRSSVARLLALCSCMVIFFIGLVGCAASRPTSHQAGPTNASDTVPEATTAITDVVPHDSQASSWIKDGKTFVLIPLAHNTDVTPFFEGDVLTLLFTPGAPPLPSPLKPVGMLRKGVPLYDDGSGKMTRLQLVLNGAAQFLLTRPSRNTLQILLVPKKSQNVSEKQTGKTKSLTGIDFSRNKEGNLFVSIKVGPEVVFEPRDDQPGKMSFFLRNAHVPARFVRLYRLEKFSTVIDSLLLRNVPGGGLLTLVSSERIPVRMDRLDGRLVLQFMTREIDRTQLRPKGKTVDQLPADQGLVARETGKNGGDFEEMNTLFPGMKKSYSGKKISIDLQDADVELVLRLIAEVSGYNLIIDDKVSGKISLKLQDIPWDQVLDLVLVQKGLGVVIKGNIMRITTAKELEAERDQLHRAREAVLQARESLTSLEPLQTKYLQINYSTAAEIEPKIREFLSPRGKISQDARTNMLIVRDAGSQLEKIKGVIEKLDRPERQVLIEARIVYATDSFQRSLGINWSGTYDHHDTSSRYSRTFNVDGVALPAGVGGMNAGVNFAKIVGLDLFSLDAQLRLGEIKDIAKTISSPRVVTLNNNRAEIKQGTRVASQTESESGGTTTQYTDAILSLSVQPQITPDNKLILDLDISDDAPAGQNILTRSTKTKMIVNNNETIVIGGVQKSTENETQDRVPGLANIPGLGWLFKNKTRTNNKEELLIFIRPRILD